MNLLQLLLGFFLLGIVEGEADAGAADAGADAGADKGADADAGADTDPADDLDLDAGADDADPGKDKGAKPREDAAAERKQLADRNAQLERELADARRGSQQRQTSEEERLRAEEDKRLADKDATDLERWQINANRELRAGRSQSQAALMQAQDLADSTKFGNLAITKPGIHKRYAERVETELQKMRANGQNAPREAILRFLIGNDAMEGKLGAKKKPAADPVARVSDDKRGKTPGARSDVSAKTKQTEHQKRMARLENQII